MPSSREQLVHFIRSVLPMPVDKAAIIAGRFHEKTIRRNDFLLHEKKRCMEFHFLYEGFMRAWTVDIEGREVTTAFYPAGTLVCELFSFFKHTPSRENIQALTDCSSLYLTFDDVQDVFHSMPEFREFGRMNLINAYAGLKQRMLSTLHETAEQRYKTLVNAAPEIFQYASLKHIASYLGVTDTSLSRIRKEFAKEQ